MQDCLEKFEGLQKEEISLPFSSEKVGADSTNLPATQKFKDTNQTTQSDTSDILIHRETGRQYFQINHQDC